MALQVRPYDAGDREAVRELCWQTAFQGEPPDFMYRDRASWVDLFTRYFTDRAPDGCFVACDGEGRVVGYLLGALDARAEQRFRVGELLRHFLLRLVWLRPACARFWWRFVWDSLRGRGGPPAVDPARWPAVFHLDLSAAARGTGAADAMFQRFVAYLRERRVAGCHAEVLAGNARMQRFLVRRGFAREGEPFAVPGMRGPAGEKLSGCRFVKSLSAAD